MSSASQSFRILGINHAGLAPKDPAVAARFLSELLGLRHLGDEYVASQKTHTGMYTSLSQGVDDGGPRLEILKDDGSPDSPIAKFLTKKGAGVHHLALTVDDVAKAIAALTAKGVRMIDETPRSGAHNTKIAFIHPESTGGLLIELVQESAHH